MSILLVLAVLVTMPEAVNQEPVDVTSAVREVDRLYDARETAVSLTLAEEWLARAPDEPELLWRAARSAFGLGVLEEIGEVRDAFYERALGYAARLAELEPGHPEGHYWMAATKGRQALHASGRTSARLAGESYDLARVVLQLDSLHAGAHHILGKVNLEVVTLSGFTRWLARNLVGNPAFEESTWEEARQHLERAVELAPEVIVYRFDLTVFYRERGDLPSARQQIEALLALEANDPFDHDLQDRAREMLDDLEE